MQEERILDPEKIEVSDDLSLRPSLLKEYIGQEKIKESLEVYIKAALSRNESLDHVLLYGPPGLGKTTLAQIVANELKVNLKVVSGPTIERSGDLAAVLSQLETGDVLFIDEIHRLPKYVEEILYSAMEDYVLDILIGKDNSAKSIRIDLPPFTLIGATTRYGDVSSPLRDRFGVIFHPDYYSTEELQEIIKRTSHVYNAKIDDAASLELAKRSRGTPRIANRLFRRVRDFAEVKNEGNIDLEITKYALSKLGVDDSGLDLRDHKYLQTLITIYRGGPVGIEALAASLAEEISTLEDVYEPYLLQEGFIKRSNRGRIATEKAYKHLNIRYNEGLFK